MESIRYCRLAGNHFREKGTGKMRRGNPSPLTSVTPAVMPVTAGPSRVKPFGPLRALDRPACSRQKRLAGDGRGMLRRGISQWNIHARERQKAQSQRQNSFPVFCSSPFHFFRHGK
jgi:hypothetical protein